MVKFQVSTQYVTDCFIGNFGTIRVKDVLFPLVRAFRSSEHNINGGGCWQKESKED